MEVISTRVKQSRKNDRTADARSSPVIKNQQQPQSDQFKASFKRFKSSSNFGSESGVFDGNSLPEISEQFQYEVLSPLRPPCESSMKSNAGTLEQKDHVDNLKLQSSFDHQYCNCSNRPFVGLKPFTEWSVIKFKFPEGLIFIRKPFTTEGQRYWIAKCFHDYPHTKQHITNIENLERLKKPPNKLPDSGETCRAQSRVDFYQKLRWVTFGYHHNWDTKIYSEDLKCVFPKDLAALTRYIALVLGFNDFKAEAAIVNYYNMDSTLSGHQDRSEDYQEAPLFSISFGQTAIFLIGGESKEIEPLPIYLESGDIVIMSGRSRMSFHGVPKIIKIRSSPPPWMGTTNRATETTNLESNHSITIQNKSKIGATGTDFSDDDHDHEDNEEPLRKKSRRIVGAGAEPEKESRLPPSCAISSFLALHNQSEENDNSTSCTSASSSFDEVLSKWDDLFLASYISRCRINLNVRQVLFPGHSSLR